MTSFCQGLYLNSADHCDTLLVMSSNHHGSTIVKLLLRLAVNVGLVLFLQTSFGNYFTLTGGVKAIVLIGLLFAVINWVVVPILNVLSLPIKLLAWIVGFVLVNLVALWIAVTFVTALELETVTLAIRGGVVGWIVVSFILGFVNWLLKGILK